MNKYYIYYVYRYILIIPGFGMISHVIGTMSDKSVFGQCGPKSILNKSILNKSIYFSQRTICRELLKSWKFFLLKKKFFMNYKLQNTMNISNKIYSFLVKIFVINNNPQITKARIISLSIFRIIYFFEFSMLVGISEAIRLLLTKYICFVFLYSFNLVFIFKIWLFSYYNKKNGLLFNNIKYSGITKDIFTKLEKNIYHNNDISNSFNEWLAGVIDGDGCFLLSKKGYASLEITIKLRDVRCLNIIKQKYGGSIKVRANQNHLRYRLHNKQGLLKLIFDINGLIRNPIRLMQLAKICEIYNICIIYPKPLNYNNGWLSGFFDTDGSVYFNLLSDQMFITASQKNKLMLDPLSELYGGSVYLSKGKEHFKWVVYRKKEVLDLLEYFKLYPPRSAKFARIKLIPKWYELRALGAHKTPKMTVLGKAWKQFLLKWDSYDEKK